MRRKKLTFSVLLTLLCALALSYQAFTDELKYLKGGWYHWDPYQYLLIDKDKDSETLTGLDVRLSRKIAETVGFSIDYSQVSWKQHLKDIAEGTRDIAAGATKTPQRETFAYFSQPYRNEENSLFVKNTFKKEFEQINSLSKFLERLEKGDFRLGVTDGFVYADPKINEYIADPAHAEYIFRFPDEAVSIKQLQADKIDGFLADRVSASTAMWRLRATSDIKEIRLNIATPIHFMFSKKSITQETVDKFNQAIELVKKTGTYGRVVSEQLFAILLMQTISQPWFFAIDIIGTFAFAISGLIVAYRDRSTLFGAFIMAALPSVGGGVLRDVLVQRPTLGIFLSPMYALIIIATVLGGFIFLRILSLFGFHPEKTSARSAHAMNMTVQVCDAAGLAAYTITGMMITIISKLEPLWLWGPIMTVLTGAGGGILRDVLRGQGLNGLKGELYAEVALCWGFIYALFLTWQREGINPDYFFNSIFAVLAGVFFTRMLAIHFKIKSFSFFLPATIEGKER